MPPLQSAGVVDVEIATEVTVELVTAFTALVPQLSRSSPPPDADQLAELIAQPGTSVFVARDDGVIVGTLTLVVFRIPTGVRAWIEDVVVDEGARGCRPSVGELLSRAALDHAAASGARTVDLTSRPSREAANRLYQRIGFQRRDTNVYRYDLEE
jgi:ribosomal protein S18 acetylase RimI-like enzyme